MTEPTWTLIEGSGQLVAAAVHSGHEMRPELLNLCALSEADRLREEDPFTERLTDIVPTRIMPRRSRFEVDLNRARHEAVYITPADAWGLQLWKEPLKPEMIEESLAYYDAFYEAMHGVLQRMKQKNGAFVVLDLHSYNHRRNGPDAPPEDPEKNPEINVGTGTMDRQYWSPLVERFISDLQSFDFMGRHLDVRENVKFYGRQLPKWTHENFPQSGCCLAIECKKFWMDEWTGKVDEEQLTTLRRALESTIQGLLQELKNYEN